MSLLRKLLLPVILILLGYAFWQSEDIKQITSGVAIFLFGMLSIEDGFQRFSGGFLERLLRSSTNRLWKSVNFGIITTTLMQSSSLVSILTISFLSAGLIDLAGGIGIIFGANIGTTTGAWLLAGYGLKVKLSTYAMPMLVFGIIFVFQKSETLKAVGWVIAGVGFLFLGIHNMKEGFEAFRGAIDLSAYAVPGFLGLLIFTALGIMATVIMQSSHATLVLIITALAASQITYENALALSIGANVGTTITAILGSLSANAAGKRLAGAHLIFNLVTAVVAIGFIHQFLIVVDWISLHVNIAEDNYTLRLAVFHTLFNVVGVILVIPFVKMLVRFLEKAIRDQTAELKQPKYLNDAVLESPHATLAAVHNESIRLYDLSLKVIANGIGFKKRELITELELNELTNYVQPVPGKNINEAYEVRIKLIFSAIVEFVVIARESMSGSSAKSLQKHSRAVRELAAAIKGVKHLQKNLLIYINSPNSEIKAAYNHLRSLIVIVIRDIQQVRELEDATEIKPKLKEALVRIEADSDLSRKRIEKMIRKEEISAEMATSLITDTEYAHDVCRRMISMAKKLFGNQMQVSAQEEEEMAEILDS